jgi:magnesium-transporting ATPase (P-type)
VGPVGLTTAEVVAERRRSGVNDVPRARPVPVWRELAAQFVHFFALLLWTAAALAVLGGVAELGIAIAAVVVVNGLVAFAQEHRAERAAARLRDLVPRRAVVVRDGRRQEIPVEDLVPGDAVVLAAGDRIGADMIAVRAHGVRVDESFLTGESDPVPVPTGGSLRAGSFLVEGEGVALVTATGARTELGELAVASRSVRRPPTPLALELRRLVRTVALMAVSAGSVLFVVMVSVLGTEPSDGFVLAVGITVALVPEGLLPTVTVALAVGARRMAHRHALVRRLEAVETLGSTTFICTDKTGTLTENEMSVVEVWTEAGTVTIEGSGYAPDAASAGAPAALDRAAIVARAALGCSGGRIVVDETTGTWSATGDPVEAAIDALAHRLGVVDDTSAAIAARFPFDPRRRRSSAVVGGWVVVKGAPDAVVPHCRRVDARIPAAIDDLARRGHRVLAVAHRPLADGERVSGADDAERDLDIVGLLAVSDPPRRSAAESIARCRAAGIRVAMITGDHRSTAVRIADVVGLRRPDDPVVAGADLPSDDRALAELVDRDGIVLHRVTPMDKLRVARALRQRGHVVAMTGDGVNDGPALREADIGIAMGRSGTDVAREAADLVLLDDDFATIVVAVELGRATYANARQFLTYHLTDNVAELTPFVVWAVSGGRFPLALGVVQILALDLGTDTLSAAALGVEPPASPAADTRPASGRLLDGTVARRAFGVLGPVEAAFGLAAFLVTLWAGGWRPTDGFPTTLHTATASGATFSTVVIAQTANGFACRRRSDPAWRPPVFGNRLLVGAVSIELAVAAVVLFVRPVADLLGHAPPGPAGWFVAVASAPAVVVADGLAKRRAARRSRTDGKSRSDQAGSSTVDDARDEPGVVESSAEAGVLDLQAAILHDGESGAAGGCGSGVVHQPELEPDRRRPDGDRLVDDPG